MKKIFSIAMVSVFAFAACEKVIDVDLNETDPQLVVEGLIRNDSVPFMVLLSKTGSYFGSTEVPKVTGATVTVTDNLGTITSLSHQGDGLYLSDSIMGVEGSTYTLKIEYEGEAYTSVSRMPSLVPLDTLFYFPDDGFGSPVNEEGDTVYNTFVNFKDPAGTANFYKYRVWVNWVEAQSDFGEILLEDPFNDGNEILFPMFGVDCFKFDTVVVEQQNIEEHTYNYFEALTEISGSGGGPSSTPYNPISNIEGENVVGYFSAYSVSRDTVVIFGF